MKLSVFVVLLAFSSILYAEDQQFARVGDLKLESGEVLRVCVVGRGKVDQELNSIYQTIDGSHRI